MSWVWKRSGRHDHDFGGSLFVFFMGFDLNDVMGAMKVESARRSI